jgi:hypothetical protein
MSDRMLNRRALLKGVVIGAAGLPAMLRTGESSAAAAAALDPNDPQAKALGYAADTAKVDGAANPTHKADQRCGRCAQYQGKAGSGSAPCAIFGGKIVSEKGWCRVYALRAGA